MLAIQDLHDNGLSAEEITAHLNEKGLTSPNGKPVSIGSVKRMLKRVIVHALIHNTMQDIDAVTLPDVVVDPMSIPDLRDMIDSCCESDEDRTIVRMRLEQYPCCSDR